ncbi:putative selenium-dependent hydroxylase accessory protein YqeC [Halobacteriales archaeon QS_3_64_16]|nr:MAG: putative selenium-dependent hydroxylase accessory protein YqeC [Halobacteriales archaeon QS_3_64_16]
MDLATALAVGDLTCVVGAGGKKTTLYALAARLDRAVVTATVRIPIFDEQVARVAVTDDPAGAIEQVAERPLGVVPEREREDRYLGYNLAVVNDFAERTDDPLLVKADGARTRWLKAPDEREPQLPREADTVLPIASARVIGEPLTDERVHRPEHVAAITERAVGEEIEPSDVAAVLASTRGGLKDVPEKATVVPVVNMVDDGELEATGRRIARGVLDRAGPGTGSPTVSRIVLARMTASDPVVNVVE